jgi:uncharacterized protein (DUF2267 family)
MINQMTTIDAFYNGVAQMGKLPTPAHAARVTSAVLHTLGFNLSGGVKKKLAQALPEVMAHDLRRGWRLINIRHNNLPLRDFLKEVALHSGNTDAQYAEMSTAAVFHHIKRNLDADVSREVARDFSPELRDFWNAA